MTAPMATKPSRVLRLNLWVANHVWVAILAVIWAVVALAFTMLIMIGRVQANAESLSELRYKSCVEDSVLNLTVRQGELVDAAFSQDTDKTQRALVPYRDALDQLRQARVVCRAQFPG